jgi:hypothetical protein
MSSNFKSANQYAPKLAEARFRIVLDYGRTDNCCVRQGHTAKPQLHICHEQRGYVAVENTWNGSLFRIKPAVIEED